MSDDDTCSICLNPVKSTRSNPPIRCGHRFHRACIERWKQQGNHTCPVCRKVFDVSKFQITLEVTNQYTLRSNALTLNDQQIFNVFDSFDIQIPADNDLDLDSLLADIGVNIADLDALLLEDDDVITNRTQSESHDP